MGTETESQPEAGTAFAAGVASEKAAQAEEVAGEAEARAESAVARAESAQEEASGAREAAWNAEDAVGQLRGEMNGAFETLRGEIADMVAPKGEKETGDEAPPPEKKEAETTEKKEPAEAAPDKPKGYGARGWFGGR